MDTFCVMRLNQCCYYYCYSYRIAAGIARRYMTRCGLDGPECEPRWGRNIPYLSRPALKLTQTTPYQVPRLLPDDKAAGSCVNLTYLFTYLLTWEANWLTASQEIPAFHGTRRFITAFTSVRHLSLSWVGPIQSIYPHPTSSRFTLVLSTNLRLGLPSGLLPSGFTSKNLYTPLSSPIRATRPAHLILLDFITRTILGEEFQSFSSSLCNLLHSPATSSRLGPNILLNTMFSNTLSFLSSCRVNDQISHPYKTIGKIIVLYMLIFKFLDSNLEDKRFCTE